MPATAFLDGRFLESLDEAKISALDMGVQHGVGLFETLTGGVRAGGGPVGGAWALHLDEHLDRLAGSAKDLGLSSSLRVGPLADAVLEVVRRSGLARARVRITITGGAGSMLVAPRPPGDLSAAAPLTPVPAQASVLIVATPATNYPAPMFEKGVSVVIADAKANPFNPHESHKTLNYWWRLRALQAAAGQGAGEALVFSVTNHLCGGCVSSAILIKGGQAVVPVARGEERSDPPAHAGSVTLPSPVRPGVTRAWAVDELISGGVVVSRQLATINDVLSADEVLLTNSSWGVLPVVSVEAHRVGTGEPGPVTRRLIERWRGEVEAAGV